MVKVPLFHRVHFNIYDFQRIKIIIYSSKSAETLAKCNVSKASLESKIYIIMFLFIFLEGSMALSLGTLKIICTMLDSLRI